MKKYFRFLATIACISVATSIHAATYNSHLIIGFTDSVHNDKEYDLGTAASITNGQLWNLSTLLTGYNLNNVSWGIVGTATIGTERTTWVTTGGLPPNTLPSLSRWSALNNAISSIYSLFPVAGTGQSVSVSPADDNSWNQQTIFGTLPTQYFNLYNQNPNLLGPGCSSFFRVVVPNLPPIPAGTFCLAANGVVTFTAPSSAPPPPVLNISRAGTVSTISFVGSNSVTYTLAYTNSSGLTVPVSTWPTLPGTIQGNNAVTNFIDTTAASDRFYRVRAQ